MWWTSVMRLLREQYSEAGGTLHGVGTLHQRLDVTGDLLVRGKPYAAFLLHVLNEALEQRDSRPMSHDVRMHRQQVKSAFVVRNVEFRLEDFVDRLK